MISQLRPVILLLVLTGSIATVGCQSDQEIDVTQDYIRDSAFEKGYAVGATYELQQDLFVVKMEDLHARLSKPGDLAPSIAAWEAGQLRKHPGIKVIGLMRAGTKVRVERIVLIKSTRSFSQITPLLLAEGINLPINPFDVSDLDHGHRGATLCKPDIRFMRAVP